MERYFFAVIDGHALYFTCKVVRCSGGFSHIADLFIDDRKVSSARKHYFNRTWEAFPFQTVLLRAIDNGMKHDEYWSVLKSYRVIIARPAR